MKSPTLALAALLGLFAASPAQAQETSLIGGAVVAAGTEEPVRDAILRLAGTSVSAVSDTEGRFVLRGIPVGTHTLTVSHPDFGEHTVDLAVSRGGETFEVLIRLSDSGLAVEVVGATVAPDPVLPAMAAAVPVTVVEETANAPVQGPAVRSGTVVDRQRILELAGASRNVGELLRRAMPSLQARNLDATAGSGLCLEFRGVGARSMAPSAAFGGCNAPQVYLDGIPLADPVMAYAMTAFDGLQWIQAIPPGEAGAQFGPSTYGVILIATTSGGTRMGAMSSNMFARSRRRTFDWEQDPNGHNFLRALLGAAAGNVAGLAAGLEVGRRCIYVEDVTRDIEFSCPTAGVAGVGVVAFALPALGSALGAHLGGSTPVSSGKLLPTLIGASMAIFPGYVFSLTTVGGGVEESNSVGKAILLVGTPLLTALADRLYRELRAR